MPQFARTAVYGIAGAFVGFLIWLGIFYGSYWLATELSGNDLDRILDQSLGRDSFATIALVLFSFLFLIGGGTGVWLARANVQHVSTKDNDSDIDPFDD